MEYVIKFTWEKSGHGHVIGLLTSLVWSVRFHWFRSRPMERLVGRSGHRKCL